MLTVTSKLKFFLERIFLRQKISDYQKISKKHTKSQKYQPFTHIIHSNTYRNPTPTRAHSLSIWPVYHTYNVNTKRTAKLRKRQQKMYQFVIWRTRFAKKCRKSRKTASKGRFYALRTSGIQESKPSSRSNLLGVSCLFVFLQVTKKTMDWLSSVGWHEAREEEEGLLNETFVVERTGYENGQTQLTKKKDDMT